MILLKKMKRFDSPVYISIKVNMIKKIPVLLMICCILCPGNGSAKMREDVTVDLKGPRGGGISPSTAKQNATNITQEVARVSALETSGDIQNTTYNSDGTLQQITFQDGTKADYGYTLKSDGQIGACTVTSQNFVVDFVADEDRRVSEIRVQSTGQKAQDAPVAIVIDVKGSGPTIYDVSHKPMPYEMAAGLNKAINDLAAVKKDALLEYKTSTNEYYDKVEKSFFDNKKSLLKVGIDVDILLKNINKQGVPDDVRRRVIDEAVGYVEATVRKEDIRDTVREFMEAEEWAKANILDKALASYEDKIKEAIAYISKVIDGLMKSKLALFMSANKERIEAIINLPEKAASQKK